MIPTFLGEQLQKRKNLGILRTLPLPQDLVDLTSNDYFGFASSADLLEKAHRKLDRIGASGSRLLTGNYPFYEELEEKIAHFHRAESCLIYNTGYVANLGLIAALGIEEATFLYDLEIVTSDILNLFANIFLLIYSILLNVPINNILEIAIANGVCEDAIFIFLIFLAI